MATESVSLSWSAPYSVSSRVPKNLPGDKILLPPSALEQLLTASTVIVTNTRAPVAAFDPFNPYSLAAARQEQSQWRDTEQRLPHPLTFRLVNPKNGSVVHAGIREFSADEGEIVLSAFLLESLGIKLSSLNGDSKTKEEHTDEEHNGLATTNGNKREDGSSVPKKSSGSGAMDDPINLESDTESPKKSKIIDLTADDDDMDTDDEPLQIIVHAKELPKGTYVRLRPLEAGYNPEDWKSLLERHLRENFTTLSMGEILAVTGGRGVGGKPEEFRFLIDKFVPQGDGICVVDTDLEVDIEALNEEQARETLKQIFAKSQLKPGSAEGSSVGGPIDIWKAADGQVLDGDYVDFQLPSWDRSRGIDISLTSEDDEQLDLFVSPFSVKQRAKPREDEHVLGDFTERPLKRIRLSSTNVELEDAEALYIAVHAPAFDPPKLHSFSLRVQIIDNADIGAEDSKGEKQEHGPEDDQCKNCFQWIPKRTMFLHENFCLRNNIACPHCLSVFKKNSSEWADHWHCPHDSSHGNNRQSQIHHDNVFHAEQSCPGCEYTALNLPDLARHRTSVCPGKLILCQFCHLEVPQEGDPFNPSAETLMTGMTAHELADGARTTDCHLCSKIIRLRDMATHLKHHNLERQSRPKPGICRNVNCGRTLDGVGKNGDLGAAARMGQGPGNDLGLCSICFGPLYANVHDPSGSAMKRRIERRYLSQMIQGCTKPWCQNIYCKTAKKNLGEASKLPQSGSIGTKEALPMVKPLMEGYLDTEKAMWFCVDEGSQKRRGIAELLSAETGRDLEWCVAAVEAESGKLDEARMWLRNWAPGP